MKGKDNIAYVPHKFIRVTFGKLNHPDFAKDEYTLINFDDEILLALDVESLEHLSQGIKNAKNKKYS